MLINVVLPRPDSPAEIRVQERYETTHPQGYAPTTMIVKCAPRLATILCLCKPRVTTWSVLGGKRTDLVGKVGNTNSIVGGRRREGRHCVANERDFEEKEDVGNNVEG